MESVHSLQELVASEGVAKMFPQGFPHAIRQVLTMLLAEPGMSQTNITRSVYTFTAAAGEVIAIARLMNSCCEQLLAIMGSALEVILIV